jgi:acetoin utilization protein AcuB
MPQETEGTMLVRDAMTSHVITISMDASVRDVREIFEAASFHHLVVTEHHRVVGVISDRDLLKNISPFIGKMAERSQDLAMLNRRVHQIMTRQLRTASPGDLLVDAGRRMMRDRISCLPVVNEQGHPVGILTIRDVAKVALDILGEAGLGEAA